MTIAKCWLLGKEEEREKGSSPALLNGKTPVDSRQNSIGPEGGNRKLESFKIYIL